MFKQLVSCSKCGADRNNWVLSRRSRTHAKKRNVKGARSIWSTIRRLNPMKGKNRIAAAKQINDSRVRHFSRATYFSNAFQNVRRFRRRELRKYSPGGDGIFVPIFAGLKFKANTFGASKVASLDRVDEVTNERKGRYALQTREAACA